MKEVFDIEIIDLHKSFKTQKVLRGLNLKIKKGELFVLLGSSGAGKSVLLKHISGLLKPDKGKIVVLDKEISSMTEKELLKFRTKIGIVFQGGGLFNSLTVYDNVAFPLRELGLISEDEIRKIVMNNLKKLKVDEFIDKMPSELSGGMIKRVALARCLCLNSEIILYDEPTAGLDPILSNDVDNIIKYFNREFKKTSLVVTHDLESAFFLADRIGVLYEGELIFVGTKEEFKKNSHPFIKDFLARYKRDFK